MLSPNIHLLEKLLTTDSPAGYTKAAEALTMKLLREYGFQPVQTRKGNIRCALGSSPKLAISAHLDTLGAMVSEILPNGLLRFRKIGSPTLASLEGEHVRLYTIDDKCFTGSMLLDNPSKHSNEALANAVRTEENMHVRLDRIVHTADDVRALGIEVGDFIAFETNTRFLEDSYVKSRFLDNKAGCFVLLEYARRVAIQGLQPPVELYFSVHEEVGHGAAGLFAPYIEELICIDMGIIDGPAGGSELQTIICAKDRSGPYDFTMRKTLTKLARKRKIPHSVDVFPFYGSDATAALNAGANLRAALIGPGVAASHGRERANLQGIEATIGLAIAYTEEKFGMCFQKGIPQTDHIATPL